VEERLEASLFLDELLPMRRKARLWDLYRRLNGAGGNAEGKSGAEGGNRADDSSVREMFNQAFTRAYEAEFSRLRRRA
jgi:predicted component of type VI protein secretion system